MNFATTRSSFPPSINGLARLVDSLLGTLRVYCRNRRGLEVIFRRSPRQALMERVAVSHPLQK